MSPISCYIFIEKGGCSVYPSVACRFFGANARQGPAPAAQAGGNIIVENKDV